MKTDTFRFKVISIFTLLFFLQACTVRTLKSIPKEELTEVQNDKMLIIHHNDQAYILSHPIIFDGGISGDIESYSLENNRNIEIYNEIHIYLNESTSGIDNQEATIKIENISKIELYEVDTGKAVLNLSAGFGVLILIASGFLVWILINSKVEPY